MPDFISTVSYFVASMWKAFIDLYDFWSLHFPQVTDAIKFMKIETLFDFWVNLSDVMQRFITVRKYKL